MINCDKCGCEMTDDFHKADCGEGGNCELCGRNLCPDCAEAWTENGECADCQSKALDLAWKVRNGVVSVHRDIGPFENPWNELNALI